MFVTQSSGSSTQTTGAGGDFTLEGLKAVVDDLFVDDATDLVEEMPANVVKRILGAGRPRDPAALINELLKIPRGTPPGGVMTTELMELTPDWTVSAGHGGHPQERL